MSDARAKAEARRAKILARDSSKKVQAIGDDISLPVDGAPVERPLAKRRQLIESLAEKAESEEQTTPVKSSGDVTASTPKDSTEGDDTPIKDTEVFESTPTTSKNNVNIDDPEVESISQLEDKLNDKNDKNETSSKKSGILKALSPKKSLKEIEEEVARNTAKYDADTMNGEPISKTKRVSKEMNVASKTRKATNTASNITPTNVTRLIRMFVIILLGSYKGYRVVQDNIVSRDSAMINAMEGLNVQNVVSFDEFGDPIALSGAERTLYEAPTIDTTTKPSRTWVQWLQYKAAAPFESTLTAVGISYWIASVLSAGINSRLKTPVKSKGILEQLMALYQSGFEGILERVFCAIGEYALHLGTILLVATALTLYTEIPAIGAGAASSVVANVVANVVTGGEAGVKTEL